MGALHWEREVGSRRRKCRAGEDVSFTSAEETTRSRSCLRSGALGLSSDIHAFETESVTIKM